ncbi:hypothetical protein GW17_00005379 [Ensete ventricosum]|nr:hypothetical protein GW17_00005379 [Ensete ventricosum]RZS02321.1 hypothetical protein BHM03_00032351 [Ensete ventricosum]
MFYWPQPWRAPMWAGAGAHVFMNQLSFVSACYCCFFCSFLGIIAILILAELILQSVPTLLGHEILPPICSPPRLGFISSPAIQTLGCLPVYFTFKIHSPAIRRLQESLPASFVFSSVIPHSCLRRFAHLFARVLSLSRSLALASLHSPHLIATAHFGDFHCESSSLPYPSKSLPLKKLSLL